MTAAECRFRGDLVERRCRSAGAASRVDRVRAARCDVNVRVVGAAIAVDTPVRDEALLLRGPHRTRSRQLMALQA